MVFDMSIARISFYLSMVEHFYNSVFYYERIFPIFLLEQEKSFITFKICFKYTRDNYNLVNLDFIELVLDSRKALVRICIMPQHSFNGFDSYYDVSVQFHVFAYANVYKSGEDIRKIPFRIHYIVVILCPNFWDII